MGPNEQATMVSGTLSFSRRYSIAKFEIRSNAVKWKGNVVFIDYKLYRAQSNPPPPSIINFWNIWPSSEPLSAVLGTNVHINVVFWDIFVIPRIG